MDTKKFVPSSYSISTLSGRHKNDQEKITDNATSSYFKKAEQKYRNIHIPFSFIKMLGFSNKKKDIISLKIYRFYLRNFQWSPNDVFIPIENLQMLPSALENNKKITLVPKYIIQKQKDVMLVPLDVLFAPKDIVLIPKKEISKLLENTLIVNKNIIPNVAEVEKEEFDSLTDEIEINLEVDKFGAVYLLIQMVQDKHEASILVVPESIVVVIGDGNEEGEDTLSVKMLNNIILYPQFSFILTSANQETVENFKREFSKLRKQHEKSLFSVLKGDCTLIQRILQSITDFTYT